MDFIIREASSKDSVLLSETAKEIWTEYYMPIIGEEQINYMLLKFQSGEAIKNQMSEGGYKYFIAFCGNCPAAYAAFIQQSPNSLFLSKLYVKKEFRGKGIAKHIISYALDSYSIADNYTITLTVNKSNFNSIAAYKKLGFEIDCAVVGEIGGGFIMDDYKMVKKHTVM